MPVGIYERKKRGKYKTSYRGSCYCCGDDKNTGYAWYRNRDREDNVLCGLCYRRLFLNPKWMPLSNKKWNPIYNKRKYRFKNMYILAANNPRQGICCWCWTIGKRTEMAHLRGYFTIFPWFGRYELCVKCHRRIDNGTLAPALVKQMKWKGYTEF